MFFTVNNHIQPSKVKITPSGKLSFVSGGTKHGWISLSGITYKAGSSVTNMVNARKIRIDTVRNHRARTHNGWKGAAQAYKQGNLCFLSGTISGGRNWRGKMLSLPKWCRPPGKLMFALSQGKQSFRVDVTKQGHIVGHRVPKQLRKTINLSSIAFSTIRGARIKFKKGFKKPRGGLVAQARRMGTMCILSGAAFNPKIRRGVHCTLKHSGSIGMLPVWCRPKKRMIFTTAASDGKVQRIDVLQNGHVRWTAGKRGKIVNLSGIKFNTASWVVRKFSKALLKTKKCQ